MRDEQLKIIRTKENVVFLPFYDKDLLDSMNEMYNKSVIIVDDSMEYSAQLINEINHAKCKNIIFVDYFSIYDKIICNLKNKKVTSIFTHEIASLTNPFTRMMFDKIVEYNDRCLFDEMYATDYSTYEVLKKSKMKIKHLKLKTTAKVSHKKSKSIGIISNDFNPNNNFYNMLTSIKMVDCDKVKFIKNMWSTGQFIDFFEIDCELCENIDEVMKDNFVNLYCNFTDNRTPLIIKSMNSGIPCIIGNCDIFDDYPVLKQHLVLKSDDDVNEIRDKINNINNVYEDVFNEYEKWLKEYK